MTRNEEVEHWYKANALKIKKWANKRSKQDAEDILQETAIRLLTSKAKWETIPKLKMNKWVMFDYYKNEKETVELADEEIPEEITQELFNRKSVEIITELVETLNGKSKEIFIMHFFQELGYDEIALKLGMSHASCKQLGSRAKLIIVEKFKEIVDK